ncbi:hypothetical protein YH66_05255 [[Brevibacterium] flavum]|uniref:Uncharacterized protein n=2 Tax=Corynebacterium TaxID=1716 RepID=A0A0F6WQ98_9CORY|nr:MULTISPECIES: hypothetical protein [Corynebacterium]AKF27005.1 hypothetical protein YH66_05255 [[Brevibacterium] flavum]ANE07827.1 hypothetical protein A3654_05245 [Corynebacterium glutamicum]AST20243.1 hypothetical protein CEY17_05310 [Corynebacterium glutamicum ATCC 14067]KEI22718.1 hypothetical protein KIQ_009095 [Corynebacterium glutamicum ATCC 14067]OKX93006.1 hypothetical protein AUP71_11095 [Corynebacterium glutamicum]
MPIIEITAKMWAQRQEDGSRILRYAGDVLNASDADAKRLIAVNAAKSVRKKVNVADQKVETPSTDDVSAPAANQSTDPDESSDEPGKQTTNQDSDEVKKPRKTANDDEWRAYAIHQGMPEEEALEKDRAELIALYA